MSKVQQPGSAYPRRSAPARFRQGGGGERRLPGCPRLPGADRTGRVLSPTARSGPLFPRRGLRSGGSGGGPGAAPEGRSAHRPERGVPGADRGAAERISIRADHLQRNGSGSARSALPVSSASAEQLRRELRQQIQADRASQAQHQRLRSTGRESMILAGVQWIGVIELRTTGPTTVRPSRPQAAMELPLAGNKQAELTQEHPRNSAAAGLRP